MKCNLCLLLFLYIAMACSFPSNAQVVTTIAGNGIKGYTGDGSAATLATLDSPCYIARDAAGNIYVDDQSNHCIRKINHTTGIITTVAGNGTPGFSGDNGQATAAQLKNNWGVAVDLSGNFYISDQTNLRIRKVNTFGTITTYAGTGLPGSTGDGGPATIATFMQPIGIATDAAGNVYVGDMGARKVRKITPAGIISTIAGSGGLGYTGDGGPATSATFNLVFGLTTDNAGNLYICDGGNDVVRKVSPAGIITTIAGNHVQGFSGDGSPATLAKLNTPGGVFVDNKGNVFIADTRNNRVRKVDTKGIINTVAGTGVAGFNGDGNSARATQLNQPVSIIVDDSESMYISDDFNYRLRKSYKILSFTNGHSYHMSVCENLTTDINAALAIIDRKAGITVVWDTVRRPVHGTAALFPHIETATGTVQTPSGLSYTPVTNYTGNDSFTVSVSDGLDSSQITLYINVDPTLSYPGVINGPSEVCVGSSISLSETVPGGAWSVSNLNAIVSGGIVIGESPGLDTVIYTITNACGTIFATKPITVNPLPNAGTIGGQDKLCIGTTVTLTNTVPGGTWSSSDTSVYISSSGDATGISAGKSVIRYTVADAHCTNKVTYPVTVDPFPVSQMLIGQNTLCVDAATNIRGTPPGGVWNLSNGNLSLSTDSVKGVAPGIDTISYIVSNFCGSDTSSEIVTINPLPDTPYITQNQSVISAAPGYSSYQWQISKTNIAGAVADTYLVAETGFYRVIVTNQVGCAAVSPEVLCTGCGVDDMRIFPNPSEGLIDIKWCKKLSVRVLCMDGKEVKLINDTNEVDIGELPNGDYMLSLFDKDGHKLKTKVVSKIDK
jgi:hypothetical protein